MLQLFNALLFMFGINAHPAFCFPACPANVLSAAAYPDSRLINQQPQTIFFPADIFTTL